MGLTISILISLGEAVAPDGCRGDGHHHSHAACCPFSLRRAAAVVLGGPPQPRPVTLVGRPKRMCDGRGLTPLHRGQRAWACKLDLFWAARQRTDVVFILGFGFIPHRVHSVPPPHFLRIACLPRLPPSFPRCLLSLWLVICAERSAPPQTCTLTLRGASLLSTTTPPPPSPPSIAGGAGRAFARWARGNGHGTHLPEACRPARRGRHEPGPHQPRPRRVSGWCACTVLTAPSNAIVPRILHSRKHYVGPMRCR